MSYAINEIFYSLQGEGVRAGTANVFVRFSGCNQTCKKETHGFDCDTEFVSSEKYSLDALLAEIKDIAPRCRSVILTGGEPGLQLDSDLITALKQQQYYLAVETNGSLEMPAGLDWITVSPKVAEHCIRQMRADEVKYVRNVGQGIPKPLCKASHKLLSPAAEGKYIDPDSLRWCIKLIKQNPEWRLSVQQHKTWNVR